MHRLAKAQCKHGEFGNWLKENCTVSPSYANSFMKLATDMPQLLNSQMSVNLSLNQAIALLNAPEEVKEEVTSKIESGEDVTIKEIQRLKKEAAESQQKNESLQNDLIYTAQQAEELRKKVINKQIEPVHNLALCTNVNERSALYRIARNCRFFFNSDAMPSSERIEFIHLVALILKSYCKSYCKFVP